MDETQRSEIETEQDHRQQRLRAAVAKTLRKRAARAAIRRDLGARRTAGLGTRHRQKLARADRYDRTAPRSES